MNEPILREARHDYIEEWYCTPPAEGVPYQVIRDEWVDNGTVRRIFAIKLR